MRGCSMTSVQRRVKVSAVSDSRGDSASASRNSMPIRRSCALGVQSRPQRLGLRGSLPRETDVLAPDLAIAGKPTEIAAAVVLRQVSQSELGDDRGGPEIEVARDARRDL